MDRTDRTVLDMDSSESPVHGEQEGSAYNGHVASVCYHPLFLFNDHGDCLAAKLRLRNVSAAPRQDGWAAGQTREVLLAPAGRAPPDAAALRVDAPSALDAARADRLTDDGAGNRLGEARAQHRRGVGELWTVAGSASGIRVAVASVMRCDPGDQNALAGESERV